MNFLEEVQKIATGMSAELKEKKGIYSLEAVVAERKAFLSKKKLTYRAKFRIDDANKEVRFTEVLIEGGFGLSSSGDGMDMGMSPGFGFKKETFNTMSGARQGGIEEQSSLFGKKYEYKFDFKKIRTEIEAKAKEEGYKFTYKITGFGL
jgi:hypothetical protein